MLQRHICHSNEDSTISPSYVRHSWKTLSKNTVVSVPVPYLRTKSAALVYRWIILPITTSTKKEYIKYSVIWENLQYDLVLRWTNLANSSLLNMPLWSLSKFRYWPYTRSADGAENQFDSCISLDKSSSRSWI